MESRTQQLYKSNQIYNASSSSHGSKPTTLNKSLRLNFHQNDFKKCFKINNLQLKDASLGQRAINFNEIMAYPIDDKKEYNKHKEHEIYRKSENFPFNMKELTSFQHIEYRKLLKKNLEHCSKSETNNGSQMKKKKSKFVQSQLLKFPQVNSHFHALFSAVEHGHLEKAKTVLESTDVDINCANTDGLSPLNVAVLVNNRSMTKMLLQHGANEKDENEVKQQLGSHLNMLLKDAEKYIQNVAGTVELSARTTTKSSFTSTIGCTGMATEKQIGFWEQRLKGLRRMVLGWDQVRPPDYPSVATIDVVGPTSVSICILEPIEGSICTKFKVQWSTRNDFINIVGECILYEWTSHQGIMGTTYHITKLTKGRRYFFRVACGNIKGWGSYKQSFPFGVVPSSWMDFENHEQRFIGKQRILNELLIAVHLTRSGRVSEPFKKNNVMQRRTVKKKTAIKQLFSASSKFQKNLRRGIYLGCLLYYEDKILITNEDFLPVIEIDETYPSSLLNDFLWFMKVTCTWDDIKSLKADMEKYSNSAIHFRLKMLTSASEMQSILSLNDLGQLFHKPLRDSHGTVVITCIKSVKNAKNISVINARWVPLFKLQKKAAALYEDNSINEILINSISDQISYNQTSTNRLPRGLYLCYLKMQSSVDNIEVLVPKKTPNFLPHTKIRDNPHVSAEEWIAIKNIYQNSNIALELNYKGEKSEVQKLFFEVLSSAFNRLFTYMNIENNDAMNHRIYDVEIIDIGFDVSFLVVCPPIESSCAAPGQRENLLQRGDLLSLTIQAFEIIHLGTYHYSILQMYSKLSCILELDMTLANHSYRQAFSNDELDTARNWLTKLQELKVKLNVCWKRVRWLMDVISYARDKFNVPTITIKQILLCNITEKSIQIPFGNNINIHLLQLPSQRESKSIKKSPGRGSWPGPSTINTLCTSSSLAIDHSKSEQNLSLSEATLNNNLNIKDPVCYDYCPTNLMRFSSSKSENTLSVSKADSFGRLDRKHSSTVFLNPEHITCSKSLNFSNNIAENITQSIASISDKNLSKNLKGIQSSAVTNEKTNTKTEHVDLIGDLACLYNESFTLAISSSNSLIIKENLPKPESSPSCKEQNVNKQHSNCEDIICFSESKANTTSTKAAFTDTSIEIDLKKKNTKNDNSYKESCLLKSTYSGIIQVFAAYETGLANGTSLKLHVTSKTTAKEVVDLVVKQLNMAIVLKGRDGPIYTVDKLDNFCLVSVIGARERCFRDDFKPLQLQNPWKKGKLFVRQKNELLAAIERSNQETHLI